MLRCPLLFGHDCISIIKAYPIVRTRVWPEDYKDVFNLKWYRI